MKDKRDLTCANSILVNEQKLTSDEEKPYREERLYFSLVEAAGSFGCYQAILFVLLSFISYLEASLIFISPYLLHQTPYSCPNLNEDCSAFVCSLSVDQRVQYLPIKSDFYSIADHYGGFRCEQAEQLKIVETMIFLGGVIGLCGFSLFAERLGRKLSLLFALGLVIVGLMLILFSWSLEMVAVGIFVTICGTQNSYQYLFCFSSEVVAEERRIQYINWLNVSYAIGILANSFTFYTLKDWRTILLFFHLFPVILTLLALIFIIQKTPIDLLANENSKQILQSLSKIASINKNISFDLTIEKIEYLRCHYKSQSQNSRNLSSLDIFRFPSLLKFTIPLMVINFAAIYLFFAPSFIIKENDNLLFSNEIITGLAALISIVITYICLTTMKRRSSMGLQFIAIVLMSLMMCLVDLDHFPIFQKIIYFLFRLSVSIMYNITFVIIFEIYPTQIRAAGCSFLVCFGEIAGIIQPWVASFCQKKSIQFESTFIVISAVALGAVYALKETYQVPPPEIIDELKAKDP